MIDILTYEFMQKAFVAGICISLSISMIGIFMVLRRYSILSDTLSHLSLAGLVIGAILHINPLLSAITLSTASSIGLEKIRQSNKVLPESILAIFLTAGLAISVFLIGIFKNQNFSIVNLLFGSILTISNEDVMLIGITAVLIIFTVLLLFRKFFAICFDEEFDQVNHVNTSLLSYILIILTSFIISISIQIVGALLISGLMIIPVLSALQYKMSFKATFFTTILFSLFSTIAGLFLSFYIATPSGATIILIALVIFIISYLINLKIK